MKGCGFLLPWAVWSSRPYGPGRPAVQAARTWAFSRSNSSAEMTPGRAGRPVWPADPRCWPGTRRGPLGVLAELLILHDRQGRQPAAQRESLAQGFVLQLKAIDFSDQVMLFGAGMLVSPLRS